MRSVHMHAIHFPKGPNIKLIANSAVLMFAACFILFMVFAMLGGADFSETMGGDWGLAFLIVGFLVSAVVAFLERGPSDSNK